MGQFKKWIVFSLLLAGACARFLANNDSLSEALENSILVHHTTSSSYLLETLEQNSNILGSLSEGDLSSLQNSPDVLHGNVSSNGTDNDECSCNWRYLEHYRVKGCVVQEYDSCSCPTKFSCPKNDTDSAISKGCVYQNKEYSVGSRLNTTNDCQVCRCRDGDPPFISCITKECFGFYNSPPQCHLVYEQNKCCPMGFKCMNDSQTSEELVIGACEYNGVLYPFGSKIYPEDDPCAICICDENWANGTSCREHDCLLEKDKSNLDAGCIPVYHEKTCCPIEFYCPSSHNFSYSIISSEEAEVADNDENDKCVFGGQLFDRGTELPMDNPCITCTCSVPPDFTCVHRSCPPTPSHENCEPAYIPGQCCPTYDCMMGDAEPVADGCPTPLCEDSSCYVGTPPGHNCPTCVCGERVSELEHNSLQQQQVQQIGQDFEPFRETYEGPSETGDDYPEDNLQMMPIRMLDSEGQASVLEKIVLPELEDMERDPEEELRELDDVSVGGNSDEMLKEEEDSILKGDLNIEPMTFEEPFEDINQNATDGVESEESDFATGSSSENGSKEKIKRSEITDAPQQMQHEIVYEPFVPQESITHLETAHGELEKEGEDSKFPGSFEDELERLRNRLFSHNDTIINEIISINHEVPVPEGCPTPMCEGNWCKIGILDGHRCPTCICRRKINEP